MVEEEKGREATRPEVKRPEALLLTGGSPPLVSFHAYNGLKFSNFWTKLGGNVVLAKIHDLAFSLF